MLNSKVEELYRDNKALRNCDQVNVEFLYSEGVYEVYKVIDYIESHGVAYMGTVTDIRESLVIIKKSDIVRIKVIVDWCDCIGRPDVDENIWHNEPSHLIWEQSLN